LEGNGALPAWPWRASYNIRQFVTDFTFQLSNAGPAGLTFVIENVGPGALGSSGGGLGYQGIAKSIAVKFDHFNACAGETGAVGLYIDGPGLTDPCGDNQYIDLSSGDLFRVHITYDGSYLTTTITDTVTLAALSFAKAIDIPHAVAGQTAYIGFTGVSGSPGSAAAVHSWQYLAETPPPNYPAAQLGFFGFQSTAGLQMNGSAITAVGYADSVLLTQGVANQASSVFYSAPQNVQAFTTDFTFELDPVSSLTDPNYVPDVADGITFTIQNAGPQALGGPGGSLGYKNIPKSVAIKFDFFNNDGEGNASTGLYLDGASPTVPSVDMTGSGISLESGGAFYAHVTYDGSILTLKLVNYSDRPEVTFTNSWSVDIPTQVGGPTAYVGFTGANGYQFSTDVLRSWTYLPGAY
jgi:Legume lectin domain/Bacterial lectin